jgi:DNA-binding transcriptional LysR family regulator
MDFEELNTFLEVIRTQSLVAAARHLHVTPSTVTARINALEEKLGQKILHRRKSGASLTSAGFKFQRYAELMSQVWRQARYEIALPPGVEAVCNAGLEFDLWHNVGSRFLAHVRLHAPRIAIAVWPGEQRQLQRWLDMGLIDIAFCYVPHASEQYTSRLLFEDELILVSAHADHSAALEYMLRTDSNGYLPARLIGPLLASGDLHRVEGAPSFSRRVYLIETALATQSWNWYEAAVSAIRFL